MLLKKALKYMLSLHFILNVKSVCSSLNLYCYG